MCPVHISADHHRWLPHRVHFRPKSGQSCFRPFGPAHPHCTARQDQCSRLGQISSDLCARHCGPCGPCGPARPAQSTAKAQHDPRPTCPPAKRAPHPLGPPHPQAPRSHPISGFHSSPRVRLRQSWQSRAAARERQEKENTREQSRQSASRAFTWSERRSDSRQQQTDKQPASRERHRNGRERRPVPWQDRRLAVSRENSPPPPKHYAVYNTTYTTCACRKRSGTRNKEQGGSQGQQRATPSRYWHCIYRFAVLTWYPHIQAGLTSWRINSAHGPERGSLHFNRCGCAGLGAVRQCGNASGQEREVRPATTHQLGIRPRGGNSNTSRHSRDKDSNCHLPPQTSTTTPATPPTVPTAGSHDPQ